MTPQPDLQKVVASALSAKGSQEWVREKSGMAMILVFLVYKYPKDTVVYSHILLRTFQLFVLGGERAQSSISLIVLFSVPDQLILYSLFPQQSEKMACQEAGTRALGLSR